MPYILLAIFVLIVIWGIYIYFENNRIDVSRYEVNVKDLPESFENYKIVQISDFHNNMLGSENCKLTDAVEKESPDIIVITGDYIDSRNTNVDISLALTEKLVKIAPVYYVTGNHERRDLVVLAELERGLKKLGVHVIRSGSEFLERNGEKIQLIGADDLAFYADESLPERDVDKQSYKMIDEIDSIKDDTCPTILLEHRPSFFDDYACIGIDVTFAGHEHGGQFRLPFIGGLYAPDEGYFPKYSEGMHTSGDSTMIVSRGLGQSVFPFRINNSPELVTAVLKRKK